MKRSDRTFEIEIIGDVQVENVPKRGKLQKSHILFCCRVCSTAICSSKRGNRGIKYDSLAEKPLRRNSSRGVGMNEELSYAEMLEIPVETVTVNRREKKRRAKEEDLAEQVVDTVNDRVESRDPAYAESSPIEREAQPQEKRSKISRRVLWGEFIAVCALCATIFLTNIFMTDSAINTFVRGLWNGNADTADTRTYEDFTLSPVVNEFTDVELAVSDTGVLSFTAACSVYAPCEGEVAAVNGDAENGYTVELKHSDTFSTVMSGLTNVYFAVGDSVRSNVPLAYTDGTHPVRVTFYEGGSLLDCVTVEGGELAWS